MKAARIAVMASLQMEETTLPYGTYFSYPQVLLYD
jgi:hypothetical protein